VRVSRLLVLVSSILFVDAMLFVALTPLVPGYVAEFGLSKGEAGLIVSSFGAGAVLGGVPAGLLALRAGPRTTVVAGLVVLTGASLAFALASDPWSLGAARFVQGAASVASWAGGLAWLTVMAPRARRGAVLGTAFGAAIAGAILGPMLGGVTDEIGAKAAFGSVSVIAAAFALWARSSPAPPQEVQRPGALRRAFRDPAYLAGMWLNFLVELLFSTMALLVPLALDDRGFSALEIGIVFFAAGLIEVVLNPMIGRISDRFGRVLPLRAALVAGVLVSIGFAVADTTGAIIALVCASAFGFGGIYAPAMALVADRAEALGLAQGLGFGLMNSFWAGGLLVGPPVAGVLAERFGDHVPYLAGVLLLVATVIASGRTVRRRLVPA
jgi:MFS family permease